MKRPYNNEDERMRDYEVELADLRAKLSASEAEVARITAELVSWKEGAEMACEEPAPRCQCAGCCLAREKAEVDR